MKLSKPRVSADWGTWKPSRISRRERFAIYSLLKAGRLPESVVNSIPPPQLEMIVKEFSHGARHSPPENRLIGIRGNVWYCEAGCGAVMQKKTDGLVFRARETGKVYVCEDCMAAHKAASEKATADGRQNREPEKANR